MFANYSYAQKEEGSDVYELEPHDSELSSHSKLGAIPFPDCTPFEADHAKATYYDNTLLEDESSDSIGNRQQPTWKERCIFHNSPPTSASCIWAYLCTADTAETPPHKR